MGVKKSSLKGDKQAFAAVIACMEGEKQNEVACALVKAHGDLVHNDRGPKKFLGRPKYFLDVPQ